jgi:hypothetical protein
MTRQGWQGCDRVVSKTLAGFSTMKIKVCQGCQGWQGILAKFATKFLMSILRFVSGQRFVAFSIFTLTTLTTLTSS